MNKVELLAPAGNFECLKAAINNGADAVYLGGKNFSARAFANNFDNDELIEAVKYAHLRNVKIYVTLNTLLTEKQFENAIKMVDFYYQNDVDALIIQDLGLYYFIKNKYPDFELHCSTQMHIHNLEGVKNAKKLGFKRVVVARESDIDFIKEATKQGIEIETFVHGAICVSYSGQCLMSSVSKNRSANKGMCAQCCRLKYELRDSKNNLINTKTNYLLSPKDMMLINDIQELIEAGVSSFKIEGRMKSSAYVGYVTRIYRKAIDNPNFKISNQELDNLKVLFNREFTNGLLYAKNNLFGQITPNHLGIKIGEVVSNKNGYTFIKLSKELNQFDGIRINEFGCIVNMLYKDNLLVNSGKQGDIVSIKTNEKLNGNVYKTLDYKLEESINNYDIKRIPLNLSVRIIPNNNVIVTINDKFEYTSNIKALEAIKAPLTNESITKQFSKLNDTLYTLNSIKIDTSNAFLSISDLNEIRRQAINEYEKYVLNRFKRNKIENNVEYTEIQINDSNELVLQNNKINNLYELNYVINPKSIYSNSDYVIISEFGGLLLPNREKIAYYTLNCSNSYCYEFFNKLGFKNIIVSTELNDNDINDLIEAYKYRNKLDIKPYKLVEGNRTLMYIKTNPFDEYVDLNSNMYYLQDFNNKYSLKKVNNITEILENNDNFSLDKLVFKN